MKKVVAVCGSPGHWLSGESQPYVEALRAAGIEAVTVAPGDTVPQDASGLVLMGGCDVNPTLYRESPHPQTQTPDDARDRMECDLIADAIGRDLPVLAICRGAQILNVALGGTLLQHLDSERHTQQPENKGQPAHPVDVRPGTLLSEIARSNILDVNSRHHQAIASLGDGLIVSARDPADGTIEAIELPGKRFLLGVQWHPENMSSSDLKQAGIFKAFAEALT